MRYDSPAMSRNCCFGVFAAALDLDCDTEVVAG